MKQSCAIQYTPTGSSKKKLISFRKTEFWAMYRQIAGTTTVLRVELINLSELRSV